MPKFGFNQMTGGRGIVNIDTVHQMVKGATNLANNANNLANNANNLANNTTNIANETNKTVNAHTAALADINTNVTVSGDLSSVEQATALADKYIYCVNKINFALGCISQFQSEIRARRDYAAVLRTIFENKFTDNSINQYGYVCIMQGTTGLNDTLGKVYFFEADKTQDGVNSYHGDYAYLNQLRADSEKRINSFFILFRQNKPAQQNVYNIIAYPWNNGIKISIIVSTPCLLNPGTYINILSGFNLTPILPVYDTLAKLPSAYLSYTTQIQEAFNNFSESEGDNRTVYQFGPVASFKTLKVIYSPDHDSWNGKFISECYIPGSNINMPKVIYQINDELNKNYTGMHEDEIVMVQYAIGDDYYTGVVKMIKDSNNDKGLCYQIISIKIDDIISPASIFSGDIDVQGNLLVSSYDKQPIIITDNTRRVTTFHNKVGINQHAYEVDALLDIDNLTNQDVIELFTQTTSGAMNSSDIINIIRTNTSSLSEIASLFEEGQTLFDYKDQCSVFTSELKYIITNNDITGLHDFNINKWSVGTFSRIQQLVKEVKQMSSEYTSAKDDSFMFTFVELFANSDLLWFFATIKVIIRQDALIFVLTKIDVTDKMIDPSYTSILTSVVDYISRINRNLNYNTLLVKNDLFYDNSNPANAFKIYDFNQEKQNNPYFSRGFDLLPESYAFFYETDTNIFKYHGAHNEWSGHSGYDCWLSSLNAGVVLENITKQQLMTYNGLQNGNFCVNYVWAGFQKIAFVHRTVIGGKEYIIGSGANIISILNKSLKVRGETKLTGDFIVDDAHNKVIFKVDNVNKTISNAYNVGIGLTTPQAMLDVKDTSVQDVIDEFAVRTTQLKLMNPILDTMGTAGFDYATQSDSSYNLVQEQTYKQYTVVYKINTSTLYAEDVNVVYHQLDASWNQKTLAAILADDIGNRSLIQSMITFLQVTLDTEMIFDGNYYIRIFDHPVYGATNVGHAIVKSGSNTYIYTHNTSLLNYNIRHALSKSVTKLFETREYTTRARSNVWRNVNGIQPSSVINFKEGQNVLNSLTQRNSDINKSIYKVVFDVTDPVNPAKIYVTDVPSFDITELPKNGPALSTKSNNVIQKFIHMINATMKAHGGFKLGYLLSVVYEDNRRDYMAVSRCYDVSGNIVTLFVPEFCLQDVLKPALSVVGDAKVIGDLLISDATENYVSIDPVQKFVGINTDDRIINYPDRKYTTTTNADDPLIGKYDAKHHVHVKGKTYPVMVSERIQEVSKLENAPKPQYFGTCSGFTVKRTSELYDFTEIVTNAQTQHLIEALDPVTKVKYGPDISFEVCDKTNRTVELGNVQMTIDKTETKNNITYLKGGFGVQVIDPPAMSDKPSTNRNIMYVDNGGTLFINQINLGGQILSVDGSGKLKWGDKYVSLSD